MLAFLFYLSVYGKKKLVIYINKRLVGHLLVY